MNQHTTARNKAAKRLSLAALVTLTACGGGGSGGTGGSPTPVPVNPIATFPMTGAYQRLFTAEGPNTALRTGLSLIHPNDRSVEYQIESTNANVTDSLVIRAGTVDVSTRKVSNLIADAVVYIVGGNVKRIPLAATGADPKAAIQEAGVTTLCEFVAESNSVTLQGSDFATPLSSTYFASTKGTDGVCGSADDGQAAVTFTPAGKPLVTVVDTSAGGLGRVLATLRNPATLKPSATVYGRAVVVSQPSRVVYSLASATSPAITKMVDVSVDLLVGEMNNRLAVVSVDGQSTQLDATVTAGTGWESAGFDSNNFYVFRNSASISNFSISTWKLVRISRVSPTATVLASGSGNLAAAAMGVNAIFATVLSSNGYSLNKISKTTPGLPTVLQAASVNLLSAVSASSLGTHMVMRTNVVNGAVSRTTIDLVDEVSNVVVHSQENASIFDLIRPDFLDLNNSVETTGFAFLGGFSNTAGSLGASLIAYNANNKSVTKIGQLPNTAEFGSSRALSTTGGSTGANFATGSLVAISNSSFLATPRRNFSFDPRVENSLQYTSAVK